MSDEKECNGICLYGADLGIPEYSDVAYAHPDCPEHGDPMAEEPPYCNGEYGGDDTCGSCDYCAPEVEDDYFLTPGGSIDTTGLCDCSDGSCSAHG